MSTAGAGDAHLSGIVVWLAAGLDLMSANAFAAIVSGLKVRSARTINPDIGSQTVNETAGAPTGRRGREWFEQLVLVRGCNYTFVLDRPEAADAHLAFACRVSETGSRRVLEVWTTKPGIDFYTSNFLDGSLLGLSGRTYRQSEGLAIEPEHFPHSPNRKNFPSTVLVPGKCYASATECRFSVGASTHHHHRNGSDDRVS